MSPPSRPAEGDLRREDAAGDGGRKGVCVDARCLGLSLPARCWRQARFALPSARSCLRGQGGEKTKGVEVTPDEANRRVDITIDGKPFTSYIWPTTLKKPVLYPIVDADGVTVTRGWPLEPRAGERTDHPHHDGLWFNYSNVNGFDFWNNSTAIPAARAAKMGTIVFDKIVSTKSGANRGELVSNSTWIDGQNHPILAETTHYVFAREDATRSIDLTVTLTALDHVVFNDDKDGLLGLRVARWLESPEEKGGTFTDANGVETKVTARRNAWRSSANRRISDQRRREGRSCVVNARPLVLADRARRRRPRCDDCDLRPSGKYRLSDLLACARLRAFCRQSAGPTCVRCASNRR